MIKRSLNVLTIALMMTVTLLTGCTQEASSVSNAQELDDGYVTSTTVQKSVYLPVGSYDSADTAILEKVNLEDETVTLYNTIAAKNYTLKYDGTTYVTDKYGTAMSIAQLSEGTIVNVNFLKTAKKLIDIQVSPDAWTYDNVRKYNLNGINSTATIGDKTYELTEGVQIFSKGKNAEIENIVAGDYLTVSGIGHEILSINVETGHGYVRLSNDEALIGGWVEIGSELITKVSDTNMLLSVPEGSYNVKIYNYNQSIDQNIIVERNQEVILDCSEISVPQIEYGQVKFNINPNTAELLLDGEKQDISRVIKTTYGVHRIEVSASGYDTLNKYINVGEEMAEIYIELEETSAYVSGNSTNTQQTQPATTTTTTTTTTTKKKSEENKNTSGNGTTSGNGGNGGNGDDQTTTGSGSATSNRELIGNYTTAQAGDNIVYLYTPEGSEVYYDGAKIEGPGAEIAKVEGAHTITLVKDGNTYSSFTIYLNKDGQDVAISFPENKY